MPRSPSGPATTQYAKPTDALKATSAGTTNAATTNPGAINPGGSGASIADATTPRTSATPSRSGGTTAQAAATTTQAQVATANSPAVTLDDEQIRLRAYLIFEARGRTGGLEREDWEQARRELLAERTGLASRRR